MLQQAPQPTNGRHLLVDQQRLTLGQQGIHHFGIKGLQEPCVHQPHCDAVQLQQPPGFLGLPHKVPVGDHRHLARMQPLPAPHRQRFGAKRLLLHGIFAVPQQVGTLRGKSRGQQPGTLRGILALCQRNAGDRQQQRNIKDPLVRNTVLPYHAAPVNAHHHIAAHPGNIVVHLVISPL